MSGARLAWIPTALLFNNQVTALQIRIYLVLSSHADIDGKSRPGHRRIASLAGCSVSTVRDNLRRMKEIGLIEIAPRYDEGRQTANWYFLKLDGVDFAGGVTASRQGGDGQPRGRGDGQPVAMNDIHKKGKEKNTASPDFLDLKTWSPPDDVKRFAINKGFEGADLTEAIDEFIDHHVGLGTNVCDANALFRGWIRRRKLPKRASDRRSVTKPSTWSVNASDGVPESWRDQWRDTLNALSDRIDPTNVKTYFERSTLDIEGDDLIVTPSGVFAFDKINQQFGEAFKAAAATTFGQTGVEVVIRKPQKRLKHGYDEAA